jgi:hypothetical protein
MTDSRSITQQLPPSSAIWDIITLERRRARHEARLALDERMQIREIMRSEMRRMGKKSNRQR